MTSLDPERLYCRPESCPLRSHVSGPVGAELRLCLGRVERAFARYSTTDFERRQAHSCAEIIGQLGRGTRAADRALELTIPGEHSATSALAMPAELSSLLDDVGDANDCLWAEVFYQLEQPGNRGWTQDIARRYQRVLLRDIEIARGDTELAASILDTGDKIRQRSPEHFELFAREHLADLQRHCDEVHLGQAFDQCRAEWETALGNWDLDSAHRQLEQANAYPAPGREGVLAAARQRYAEMVSALRRVDAVLGPDRFENSQFMTVPPVATDAQRLQVPRASIDEICAALQPPACSPGWPEDIATRIRSMESAARVMVESWSQQPIVLDRDLRSLARPDSLADVRERKDTLDAARWSWRKIFSATRYFGAAADALDAVSVLADLIESVRAAVGQADLASFLDCAASLFDTLDEFRGDAQLDELVGALASLDRVARALAADRVAEPSLHQEVVNYWNDWPLAETLSARSARIRTQQNHLRSARDYLRQGDIGKAEQELAYPVLADSFEAADLRGEVQRAHRLTEARYLADMGKFGDARELLANAGFEGDDLHWLDRMESNHTRIKELCDQVTGLRSSRDTSALHDRIAQLARREGALAAESREYLAQSDGLALRDISGQLAVAARRAIDRLTSHPPWLRQLDATEIAAERQRVATANEAIVGLESLLTEQDLHRLSELIAADKCLLAGHEQLLAGELPDAVAPAPVTAARESIAWLKQELRIRRAVSNEDLDEQVNCIVELGAERCRQGGHSLDGLVWRLLAAADQKRLELLHAFVGSSENNPGENNPVDLAIAALQLATGGHPDRHRIMGFAGLARDCAVDRKFAVRCVGWLVERWTTLEWPIASHCLNEALSDESGLASAWTAETPLSAAVLAAQRVVADCKRCAQDPTSTWQALAGALGELDRIKAIFDQATLFGYAEQFSMADEATLLGKDLSNAVEGNREFTAMINGIYTPTQTRRTIQRILDRLPVPDIPLAVSLRDKLGELAHTGKAVERCIDTLVGRLRSGVLVTAEDSAGSSSLVAMWTSAVDSAAEAPPVRRYLDRIRQELASEPQLTPYIDNHGTPRDIDGVTEMLDRVCSNSMAIETLAIAMRDLAKKRPRVPSRHDLREISQDRAAELLGGPVHELLSDQFDRAYPPLCQAAIERWTDLFGDTFDTATGSGKLVLLWRVVQRGKSPEEM
ncbi:MAG: hypothetical protein MJE77_08930 [Proteobacteria bacterium]|nr:hypothetical protein [Pseudomonadota bacterium]